MFWHQMSLVVESLVVESGKWECGYTACCSADRGIRVVCLLHVLWWGDERSGGFFV